MTLVPISRRGFLAGTGVSVAAASLPAATYASPSSEASPLIELHITRRNMTIGGQTAPAYLINDSLPGPTLRWREGQEVRIRVHNHLDEMTTIHWHGIRLPADQDGVPGLSYKGIPAGESFTYSFPVQQSGTYWYHSHAGGQEPCGMYGALIIDPAGEDPLPAVDRDYILLLSDWSDVSPAQIISNLKMQDDYYNFRQRSVASLAHEARQGGGIIPALKDRLTWSHMRMSATDISDVSGVIYQYLLNGQTHNEGWSGLFRPGEKIRLRFVNGAAMTLFDIRIPGLDMAIVEADGNPVAPVTVDEFRIGVGETYAVVVQPRRNEAYTIFAQSEDRTGYARGTLTPRDGLKGAIPPMDPRPVRTMVDMGMDMMMHGGMQGMSTMEKSSSASFPMAAEIDDPGPPPLNVENQNRAKHPIDRTTSPGDGLEHNGRRVLAYSQLRSVRRAMDLRPPSREIILHATGNMERYIWGFNGRKFSESGPIRLRHNERVRFTIINDTMMEHPFHLHGLWIELENGQGDYRPIKHTVISQPGSIMRFLVTADVPGMWAFHCHLMYHMATGMFRVVSVS
ncbi:copper resistance system multicopper oxidase [Saccharibacter sp. 17.LH.SD]|uniref:copper resistance system multicopper oxidase n=1 Tax=Saccharibacter sp. 17.LH.SD TaxID=2689393 RepID=UPI00136E96B3|nr:copper resistance system multicopper oxidase [Saccharibacter sp. 17.LH.SD]MXV45166.1 copper resistance system multicopper oxidase [Saccharibacter sp. 17.LH.SD]